jgi:non-specific serine/threonine protein kinase/serine/threonine-protein kinase
VCPRCLVEAAVEEPTYGGDDEEAGSTDAQPPETVGRSIGSYRLLKKIGQGGMGEVWEAEQEEPVCRKVALKLIKWGMDTKAVVARFEAERQALAVMDHPNVAKVFDAGSTEQGRPYFVMEFVKGVSITEHCDAHGLTTDERLGLFMQVCEGVQHAHQKGIIHRDIKPSNILVQLEDDRRTPKIIDFGVAKATDQRLAERTLVTELGQIIGTPEYISPEQAEMTVDDIDTRTDVYSLGVLLYELLAGALPFDPRELRRAGFDEIRRKIREEEPSRPSARISTLGEAATESARCRHTDPTSLVRKLRGDLDWITMRALEKDRSRRYGSPSELAEDIRRHLRHEPVTAGPPSVLYRARKFVRRHRIGVAATVLALGVLVAFTATTIVQSRRIAREAETSDRVSDFLADMLGKVEPKVLGTALWEDLQERVEDVRRDRGESEREIEAVLASLEVALSGVNATDAALRLLDEQILLRAGETIENELADEPRIAGRLERTIAETYRNLGLYERAERHAKRALEIRSEAFGAEHLDTMKSKQTLGIVYYEQGRLDEAEPLLVEALETHQRLHGDDCPVTAGLPNQLAVLYHRQGRWDEAETMFLVTLEALRRRLGNDHRGTIDVMSNLAVLYEDSGRYDEAERLLLETLEARKRVLGDDHRSTLATMNNLAILYKSQKRYEEAEPLFLETLEAKKRVLGDDHKETLRTMMNLANLYQAQRRYDKAESLYLEANEHQKRVIGEEHWETLVCMSNLANLYVRQLRYDEAEPLLLEVLETQKRLLGDDHPQTLVFMVGLGDLRTRQGKYEEAGTLIREALNGFLRSLNEEHPWATGALYYLGCLAAASGKRGEALDHLRKAVSLGWAEPDILEDPTLDSLRGDPEFEAIEAEVRKRVEEE